MPLLEALDLIRVMSCSIDANEAIVASLYSLYVRIRVDSAHEHVLGVDLHVHLGVQRDLVGPLHHRRIDHDPAVEGVVEEAGMQVQLVAIWLHLSRKTTLGDELLLLRQVDGSAGLCALQRRHVKVEGIYLFYSQDTRTYHGYTSGDEDEEKNPHPCHSVRPHHEGYAFLYDRKRKLKKQGRGKFLNFGWYDLSDLINRKRKQVNRF